MKILLLFTNISIIFDIIFSTIKLEVLILKEENYNLNIHVIIEKEESILFSKINNKNNKNFSNKNKKFLIILEKL